MMLLNEVECHCQTTGVPYLQVDVADTTRWQQQAIPVYPIVGIGDISFISHDESFAESFEDGHVTAILIWHRDHLMMCFMETSWHGSVCMQGTKP